MSFFVITGGLGLAGVLTFVLWMIGSYAVFDGTTSQGTRSSIWLLCSVTIALSIIAIVFQSILFRKLWVRAHFSKSSDVEEQHDVVKEGTYEREGLVGVLKRAVWVGVLQFLLFTVTLTLFPTFGPLAWYQAKSMDYDTAHVPRYFNAQRDSLIVSFH